MLAETDAASLISSLWPKWVDGRSKSKELQDWALGNQPLPSVPDTATDEYKRLQEKSVTPWMGLLVQSMTQALQVIGYRPKGADADNMLWGVWQQNQMDSKQIGLYEAAFTTGISYVAVLPTEEPGRAPEWRPYSSAEMTAFYESPYDKWPAYAVAAEPLPNWRQNAATTKYRGVLFDDTHVYLFTHEAGASPGIVGVREHGLGVCPVVAYTNRKTITGRAIGEVEPYLAIASRIDQDVFDRLIVQRFGSWRVRTATGLETPQNPDALQKQEIDLKVGDILVSDSEKTVFGSLPGTELDGHLRAPTEDIRMLAAVSQTPPQLLTSDLVNVSADALAAIEAGYNRKIEQRKTTFGESHEQAFALTAQILGEDVDDAAQVQWREMETRSLAAVADAWGKIVTMLGLPPEIAWDKLGFLTEQDKERARQLIADGDSIANVLAELAAGTTVNADTDRDA